MQFLTLAYNKIYSKNEFSLKISIIFIYKTLLGIYVEFMLQELNSFDLGNHEDSKIIISYLLISFLEYFKSHIKDKDIRKKYDMKLRESFKALNQPSKMEQKKLALNLFGLTYTQIIKEIADGNDENTRKIKDVI